MTLTIKAFENKGQFDEVKVTQIKKFPGDLRGYRIDKPLGGYPIIKHYRSDGWMTLASKVFKSIERYSGRSDRVLQGSGRYRLEKGRLKALGGLPR
jgi:hypothetical protein